MIHQARDRFMSDTRVTVEPRDAEALAAPLGRNIEALRRRREQEAASATWQDRLSDRITGFTGSMTFVFLHLALFGFWVVANLGWIPSVEPWDDSFVVLAMIASVEAIFLSTFVLITQNRMAKAADQRDDLDLQTNLLAEHEVTRLIEMVAAITDHLGIGEAKPDDLDDLKRDIAPERVMDAIEATKRRDDA
jgi:uncharacterized membrane protein